MTIRVLPSSEELLGVLVGRVVPFSSVVPNKSCLVRMTSFLFWFKDVNCNCVISCASLVVNEKGALRFLYLCYASDDP